MNSSLGDLTPASASVSQSPEAQNLESRTDANGVTTYHLKTLDRRTGTYTEKIFDADHRLSAVKRTNGTSRSDSTFDVNTGEMTRLCEVSTLPDGSTMTKDVTYARANRSFELVVVVAPNGERVRKVERQHVGMRTIFQGQTEFMNGAPITTVNHYMDMATGRMMRREQIHWRLEGQRALSENIHFDKSGFVSRYTKIVYHSNAGPFLEEIQDFYKGSNCVKTRKVSAYNLSGIQTCFDLVEYSEHGSVASRHSSFFDDLGNPIATEN